MITIIGTIAAVLTTTAMFPQAVRILRTKDVHGISFWMYLANTSGIIFWLIYGILLGEMPIIVANSIAIFPASLILYLKLKLGSKSSKMIEVKKEHPTNQLLVD